MGKAAMCIKMLQLLNSGAIYKVSEIASYLDTNTRNVIEYKKELEEVGYYINSIPGRYGGYQLERKELIPSLKLLESEKRAILESYKFVLKSDEFPYKEDYEKGMSGIFSSITMDEIDLPDTMHTSRFSLAMSPTELSNRYKAISNAIQKKKKIEIDYHSRDNRYRVRTIHPYKLYMYNGTWFVLAWCELVCDFRYFKLCRIRSMRSLDADFVMNTYFKEQDYLDNYGMKKMGEWTEVKFRFTGKAASYTQDYTYGKDQVVEVFPDLSTIITVKMQFKDSLAKFVLGFAGECQVISPQWLKDEIASIANRLLEGNSETKEAKE